MRIEQAVFTSAETDRLAGYQVVARSPGVCEADCRELAVWCPSHDSLLDLGPGAMSVNFHPLPSGASCVSRTTPAGWEYSGRGGVRVYTHCLLVPAAVLGQFSNNPFALLRAVEALGVMEAAPHRGARLEPLSLAGGAGLVDEALLAQLALCPGPQSMAALVQAALNAACLAVAGPLAAAPLMAGLLNCLPPQCRTDFSFSTGLKFSSRRPFRLIALPGDPAQRRWLVHHGNVTAFDLADVTSLATMPIEGWAQLISRALSSGRTAFLSSQCSARGCDLAPEDLSALGLQLLEDLDASTACEEQSHDDDCARPGGDLRLQTPGAAACYTHAGFHAGCHAHAGHGHTSGAARPRERGQGAGQVGSEETPLAAAEKPRDPTSPAVIELLEYLDDVAFAALDGEQRALEELETLWPQLVGELGETLLCESRQQYLRYALTVWDDCATTDTVRDPSRAIHALDVLCMLFNEV